MQKRKRSIIFLPLSVLAFAGVGYIIFRVPPDYSFRFSFIHIPVLICFFILFFVGISLLTGFIGKNIGQGYIIATGVVGFLLLRYIHLAQIFFLLLLLAILAIAELLVAKKTQK